ncbi:MAG: hypothetical protein H6R24_1481 [Proteobacteria bacterium]|nr:hypothetical protein [Pseudomonadota bacterium]
MLMNLLFGLLTMIACLLLQSVLVIAAIRYYWQHERSPNNPSFWSSGVLITGVMLLLVIGNMAQVGVWALLFVLLEEFQQFGEAFYHSAVNFATLAKHKLLGPLEAINGALMIGVSTAALISIFQQVIQTTAGARRR